MEFVSIPLKIWVLLVVLYSTLKTVRMLRPQGKWEKLIWGLHVNTDFFKFLFLQSFTRTTAKQFVWCTMPVTWHASRRGLNHKVSQSHSAIVMQLPSLLGSPHAPSSGIASCLTKQLGPFIPLSSGYEWISACLMKLATKPSVEEKGMNEKQIQEQTLDSRRQFNKKIKGWEHSELKV